MKSQLLTVAIAIHLVACIIAIFATGFGANAASSAKPNRESKLVKVSLPEAKHEPVKEIIAPPIDGPFIEDSESGIDSSPDDDWRESEPIEFSEILNPYIVKSRGESRMTTNSSEL